jgi:phosphoserine aminotransferase
MSQATAKKVYNLNAGPAILPRPVLEQVQAEFLDYADTGMSVVEISHRSKHFEALIGQAEADIRELMQIPGSYKVLFLQGGATTQFAMIPMNLRPPGGSADYIVSGHWTRLALEDARRLGGARVAATGEATSFDRLPDQAQLDLDPRAAYLYIASNETIHGLEWAAEPEPPLGVPLVADMSSNILSRPVDVSKYGLIYAGAQKNLGPAGVTIVILDEALLERAPSDLPIMLDYRTHAKHGSLYNTPPVFSIYVVGLVLRWLRGLGGLGEIGRRNQAKADCLYQTIDASGGFYRGHAQAGARSRMNVTFRLPTEDLEAELLKRAAGEGFVGLKGHRSLGGLRASLYNALPLEAVQALTDMMREFQRTHG